MNGTEQKTSQTPYSAWLQTEILHTLQRTVSDHPGEYTFLINVQVQELYWALIVREMQAAQASLREDNLEGSRSLAQSGGSPRIPERDLAVSILDHPVGLDADFGGGRSYTRSRHGSSGMDLSAHGLPVRHQARTALGAFRAATTSIRTASESPEQPSLYDDVLAFLSRRGFKIPAEVLRGDPSKTYAPDPEVEKVWAAAYETDPLVKMLGETMADIAEEFTTWKYRHLMATHRTIGNRSAYFGIPAVS